VCQGGFIGHYHLNIEFFEVDNNILWVKADGGVYFGAWVLAATVDYKAA
jgi:hypothetical protein